MKLKRKCTIQCDNIINEGFAPVENVLSNISDDKDLARFQRKCLFFILHD